MHFEVKGPGFGVKALYTPSHDASPKPYKP